MNAIALVDLHGSRQPDTDHLASLIAADGWTVNRHDGRAGRLPTGKEPVVVIGGPGTPNERGIWRVRLEAAMAQWAMERPLLAVGLGFPILAAAMRWPVRPLDEPRRGWYPLALAAEGLADPVMSAVCQGAHGYEDRPWAVLPPPAATVSRNTVLSYTSVGDIAAARLGRHALGLAFHPGAMQGRPSEAVPAGIVNRFFTLSRETSP